MRCLGAGAGEGSKQGIRFIVLGSGFGAHDLGFRV